MITIECNFCGESLKTRDVKRAVAFDQEHKDLHPEEALRATLQGGLEGGAS